MITKFSIIIAKESRKNAVNNFERFTELEEGFKQKMLPGKHAISGFELMLKWDTDEHELSYLILKHGIMVFDSFKFPKIKFSFNPDHYKLDFTKILDIINNDPYSISEMLFWGPELEKLSIEKEISSLKSKATSKPPSSASPPLGRYCRTDSKVRYRRDDQSRALPRYSRKKSKVSEPKPSSRVDNEPSESNLKNVIEDHEEGIKQHSNVFSLLGKVWFVKFKQQEWGLYPDQEKYRYIANFLSLPAAYPDKKDLKYSIYNTELVSRVKGKDLSEVYQNDDTKDVINESNLTDELTPEELDRFKDQGYNLLQDLIKANNSGNLKRIDDAQDKVDKYRLYLLNEYGISTNISKDGQDIYFKKLYRSNKEHEKIRQLIKNQTNNAIKDFSEKMPTLRRHLQSSINPKLIKSMYYPEILYDWHVSM